MTMGIDQPRQQNRFPKIHRPARLGLGDVPPSADPEDALADDTDGPVLNRRLGNREDEAAAQDQMSDS